jgi:hypothetical protein
LSDSPTDPEELAARVPPSGADQAKALREQARKGGLKFDAYLPSDIADWLLDMIERGIFTDPSEAVFVILWEHMELQPHKDLRDELLRRRVQVAIDDPGPLLDSHDVRARLEELIATRSEPGVWTKQI